MEVGVAFIEWLSWICYLGSGFGENSTTLEEMLFIP